ncbi:MAG: hydrogenase formation protein HypD [Elusimicrobiota bacterium]
MITFIKKIKSLAVKKVNSVRNPALRDAISNRVNIMEVCGTHTMAIASAGIKSLLPKNINLISGPGCPVCVTPAGIIDSAIELAKNECIVSTFGDMMKVPGSISSLEKEKSNGCDIRIVYSAQDSLEIARKNPKKEVVFVGVGFETTSPTIAATVKIADKEKIKNFSVIPAFKLIPPALEIILEQKKNKN